MRRNKCIDMDAYKAVHPLAINQGLTKQYSYGEARIGAKYPTTSFFGLDMIVQDSFLGIPSLGDLTEAEEELFSTFGYDVFNMKNKPTDLSSREVWEKVINIGYLPMEIKAVPEGTLVPQNNVLFTVESTEKWFAKYAQGSETLNMHVWYPTLISTRFKYIKESVRPLVELSGTIELLDFMINDFGARGGAGFEASTMGGMAVLLHGQGSDNMSASRLIKDYYGYQGRAKSVWATEHSTALSYGKGEGEYNYIIAQLDNAPLDKIVSIVIDTYDSKNFMYNVVGRDDIKARINARSVAGGRTVFRPDSGTPSEQVDMCLDALTNHFGYKLNQKGYKVLESGVGIIQGDGMDENSIVQLYKHIVKNHWSTDNLVVGSGGGLLQVDANRDVLRFAIKPSFGIINGEEINFEKKPKSDLTKTSKSGKLLLYPEYDGSFTTYSSRDNSPVEFSGFQKSDALKTILKNGEFCSQNKFMEMVERASRPFKEKELILL